MTAATPAEGVGDHSSGASGGKRSEEGAGAAGALGDSTGVGASGVAAPAVSESVHESSMSRDDLLAKARCGSGCLLRGWNGLTSVDLPLSCSARNVIIKHYKSVDGCNNNIEQPETTGLNSLVDYIYNASACASAACKAT